jgi:hypothetical protein
VDCLFRLALHIAKREQSCGYAGIDEIIGPYSWSFLEHITELPEAGKIGLLHALIRRRFARERVEPAESIISENDQSEINHWLMHNNSRHGTRSVEFFAWSEREEVFVKNKSSMKLALKKNIQLSVKAALKASAVGTKIIVDSASEVRWQSTLVNSLKVDGWMDFGEIKEQATTFFVIHAKKCPLHVPSSLLGILGIGQDTWSFIQEGQERLCASTTVHFFEEVCSAVAEIKL